LGVDVAETHEALVLYVKRDLIDATPQGVINYMYADYFELYSQPKERID